jgi:hypothetical protein
MANSKDIQRIASEIKTSSKASLTNPGSDAKKIVDPKLIEAINQVFSLFKINYHNQYFSAFSDSVESEKIAKRLWLSKLNHFSPATICSAAEKIVADSTYLPTLSKMIEACKSRSLPAALTDVRLAYREACQKPSPKIRQDWSHPIVYFAGRDTGWNYLSSEVERKALPAFTSIFEVYCDRMAKGEKFTIERIEPETQLEQAPASDNFNKEQIEALKNLF